MSTKQQVEKDQIFNVAAEILEPVDRAAYLDQACGGDADLRADIEDLLRHDVDAGSFLEKPTSGLMSTMANGERDTLDDSPDEISLEFLARSDKPNCIGTLAHYEVLELVGRGGMGLVLRALDPKLNRVVAIKVLAPEFAANPMAVKRFLREARAAAAVNHDHVVTIHAIHDAHSPPFIVMEFVDGWSMQEKIDHTGGLELKEILRIGMQTARGLAAAHEQGLVHRDIKPANVLLENGVERVKITDFGLARAVDDVSVTRTGEIAGTPQFMSPEQAQGQPIDARSDLFSLGSVFYTMCTGRPAFRAETAVAMLRRVTDDTPRPIRESNPDVPDWLESIIFKLLAKDPDKRIQSANEVADLLGQHLAHLQKPTTSPNPQPVAPPPEAGLSPEPKPDGVSNAKPVPDGSPQPSKSRRWRLAATVTALVLLAAISLGMIIYVETDKGQFIIEADDENVVVIVNQKGVKIRDETNRREYLLRSGESNIRTGKYDIDVSELPDGLEFSTSKFTLKRGERQRVKVWLKPKSDAPVQLTASQQTPLDREKDIKRSGQIDALKKQVNANPSDDPHDPTVAELRARLVDFRRKHYNSPEAVEAAELMSRLAWPADALERTDLAEDSLRAAGHGDLTSAPGELVAVLGDAPLMLWNNPNFVAFTPDGDALVSGCWTGNAQQWDVSTGRLLSTTAADAQRARFALSRDGSLLVTATRTASGQVSIKLLNRNTAEVRQLHDRQWSTVESLAISPDGQTIAAGGPGTINLIERASGKVVRTVNAHSSRVVSLAYHSDGMSLASGGADGTVKLWQLDELEREPVTLRGHTRRVFAVAFSPQGDQLASAGEDRTVRLWSTNNGKAKRIIRAHTDRVISVAFSPDGTTLASGGVDGTIKILDVETGEAQSSLSVSGYVWSLAFSPNGQRLASTANQSIALWDMRTGRRLHTRKGHTDRVSAVSVSRDGKRIASVGFDGTVQLWQTATRTREWTYKPDMPTAFYGVAFSVNGKSIATGNSENVISLLNANTGHLQNASPPGRFAARGLAFSPDDKLVASGGEREVVLWNAATGSSERVLPTGDSNIWCAAYSRDGRTVAAGGSNGRVLVFDLTNSDNPSTWAASKSAITSLAFSADGRTLATIGWDDKLRLWDVATRRLRCEFPSDPSPDYRPDHWSEVVSVCYSPSGSLLATSGFDGVVRVWPASGGEARHEISICPPGGRINQVAFTPDGRHLVTANGNGTVYLLRLASRI